MKIIERKKHLQTAQDHDHDSEDDFEKVSLITYLTKKETEEKFQSKFFDYGQVQRPYSTS